MLDTKLCTKCKKEKPATDFGFLRGGANGLRSQCKPCRAEANLAWNRRNAERVKRTTSSWRKDNAKEIKEYNKTYKKLNKDRVLQRAAEWKRENPDRIRAINTKGKIKARYGLLVEEYEDILEFQDGACAICHTKDPGYHGRLHIDHCHKTGDIRGLLCSRCNTGLGMFMDDPQKLLAAITYLSQHKAATEAKERRLEAA